jgi:hypothetical protein
MFAAKKARFVHRVHAGLAYDYHNKQPWSSEYPMVQLVDILRCKLESHGFFSRRRHLHFALTLPFRPHYGP